MERVKSGDIVRLKSGGPAMTVQSEMSDGTLLCQWFVGQKVESAYFKEAQLDSSTPDTRTSYR